MRGTSVRKVYRRLSPGERYRLALAADARGDEAEREALVSGCPRMVVKTIHLDFEEALDATWALLDVAVPSLVRFLGWLEALEAVHAPIQEAVACLVGAPVPDPGEHPPFVCQEIARRFALQSLGAVMAALAEVCSDHGLDSTEVLGAFAPSIAETLAGRKEAIEAAGSAPECQEWFRSRLARAWRASLP